MLPIIYVDVKEAHRVGGLRILHILTAVVRRLVELVAHEVGHGFHLPHMLVFRLMFI